MLESAISFWRRSAVHRCTVSVFLAAILVPGLVVQAEVSKSLPGDESEEITTTRKNMLVTLCESCHGPGGRSERTEVPALAGRDADELFAEIERFYFYERLCPNVPVDAGNASGGHMSMCDVTDSLNKPEAQALARHFEAQPVE